jgi:hypothetical protein
LQRRIARATDPFLKHDLPHDDFSTSEHSVRTHASADHWHHFLCAAGFARRTCCPARLLRRPALQRHDPDWVPPPRDASICAVLWALLFLPHESTTVARLRIFPPSLTCGSHRDAGMIGQHFGTSPKIIGCCARFWLMLVPDNGKDACQSHFVPELHLPEQPWLGLKERSFLVRDIPLDASLISRSVARGHVESCCCAACHVSSPHATLQRQRSVQRRIRSR